MSKNILEIKNLTFSYATRNVLENINLIVQPNDFLAIIGPNGGGKSTLLKLIMGLLPLQSGSIKINNLPPKKGRKHIGYLSQFQHVDMTFPITVEEIVMMTALRSKPYGRIPKTLKQQVQQTLDRVGIGDLTQKSLSELSGGQKQRVFLARVLIEQPKLLILDEPTTSIDIHAEQTFYDFLKELNKTMAIIMISHDISAVSNIVHKIACLNKNLIYHNTKEISKDDLEKTYACDINLIAHGVPHRVLKDHHDHSHS